MEPTGVTYIAIPAAAGPVGGTYDEASTKARELAGTGQTQVIYKLVPVARFEATVTVTEHQSDTAGQ
jgi:hypothetical protein